MCVSFSRSFPYTPAFRLTGELPPLLLLNTFSIYICFVCLFACACPSFPFLSLPFCSACFCLHVCVCFTLLPTTTTLGTVCLFSMSLTLICFCFCFYPFPYFLSIPSIHPRLADDQLQQMIDRYAVSSGSYHHHHNPLISILLEFAVFPAVASTVPQALILQFEKF